MAVRTARRATPALIALVVTLVIVLFAGLPTPEAASSSPTPDLGRTADEEVDVYEIIVDGTAEMDRLVATGVDLDHHVHPSARGIVLHAVVSANERSALKREGFTFGKRVHSNEDTEEVLAERDATIAAHAAENEAFAAEVAAAEVTNAPTPDVKIIRADYYTTTTGQGVLSVEAKWVNGQTATNALTVQRDSGPGTAIGSGGSQNISRFVDASVYLYHRGAANVATRPDRIRITSPTGGVAEATVKDWLPLEGSKDYEAGEGYQKGFIYSYMTPTDLYERIHQLAAEFPEISEIVELPKKTNGYRRKAQTVFGNANTNRVAIDSHAWGHEGGNDISVALLNPGVADSPLSVARVGSMIQVSLATNASGAITSTAAQVVAAINAHAGASELVFAYTYRGSTGTGVVAAAAARNLSDGLSAPDSVSRDPHPVYAIRIGKHRDGSKMGVLAYAQEHAREWVPPLVTIEAAERLLRNYAHDGRTKQLVNNLDIWIAPSINPDGGHYSFYDFASQRKSMTNHCPYTGSADFDGRNSWGVDNNRNYTEYSLFDGYSGASLSCTSGNYAGPSELSEPENINVDFLAQQNIKFSMNLHSSGNYFMWSPGSYATPGRISAPRPTLEQEGYFWGASSRILTAIKRHRGLSVTPARTGPISDVLYSAAGNSGDMLWYKYGIYAWNFEVGTSFQPPFVGSATGASAYQESQEFANGLIEMFRVAYDFGKDNQRPESTLVVKATDVAGMVDIEFATSEPAAVMYTLDGSTPTFSSTMYASAGIREDGETLRVPAGTRVHWFSVDSAGNVENNYRADGKGKNFKKGVAALAP